MLDTVEHCTSACTSTYALARFMHNTSFNLHTSSSPSSSDHCSIFLSSSSAGWFCGSVPSVSNFTGLQVLQPGSSEWQQLAIPAGIKALVLVNLQSYGGGRNIWGESESKRRSWKAPDVADGLIEVRLLVVAVRVRQCWVRRGRCHCWRTSAVPGGMPCVLTATNGFVGRRLRCSFGAGMLEQGPLLVFCEYVECL
jgi:hypothetical protein